ncbi:hypothetical protein HALLA_12010 [Halostagnicola larsenii XH-48]|uniref:Helix-hairpin-helix DNA-binding motif class 1 domain-containing protein n=1 Tax=Halostagnicola larsenii XH-48 TaxID=797299 RepID=W0JQS2_9EURY|nr:terminase small subunit [Halostagnicola larsenii]AHG00902.1 hypothetical protein HALLA_11720 [Halostagnicola larsenii XH-48]AHG00949.1 hypothetical protein HALLA_12010 [Halostagnicola larsenii XH-48]
MTELTSIDGVGPAIAEQLEAAGFETADDVLSSTVDELADVHMIGESSAESILEGDDDGTRGRPSKLEDHWDDIMDAAKVGMSKKGIARTVGIDESTLHDWENKDAKFSESLKRARAVGERRLITSGLYDEDVDTGMARFLLERSYLYVKTEKQEVDLTEERELSFSDEERQKLAGAFEGNPET